MRAALHQIELYRYHLRSLWTYPESNRDPLSANQEYCLYTIGPTIQLILSVYLTVVDGFEPTSAVNAPIFKTGTPTTGDNTTTMPQGGIEPPSLDFQSSTFTIKLLRHDIYQTILPGIEPGAFDRQSNMLPRHHRIVMKTPGIEPGFLPPLGSVIPLYYAFICLKVTFSRVLSPLRHDICHKILQGIYSTVDGFEPTSELTHQGSNLAPLPLGTILSLCLKVESNHRQLLTKQLSYH